MALSKTALAVSFLLVSSPVFAFPENVTLSAPAGAVEFGYALAAGDLNGDDFPDLVVGAPGSGGGALYLYPGGGDGLGVEPFWSMQLDSSFGSGMGTAISVVDVDDDELPDILVLIDDGSPGGPYPYVIPGTGTAEGPLKVINSRPPDTQVLFTRSIAADFDQDEYDDGAVGDPASGTVAVRYTDNPMVNDPPVWPGQTIEIKPEASAGAVLGRVEAFDPEGGPLTFEKTDGSLTDFVSLDLNTGVLTLTDPSLIPAPELGEDLTITMPVEVSDGEGFTINDVEFEILHKETDQGWFIGPCFLEALSF